MKLTDTDIDIREIVQNLEAGEPLSEKWRGRLFPGSGRATEIGKEYRLVYDGKMRREEVLAQTPAAPWQLVRQFCTERPHPDGCRASVLAESKKHNNQNRGCKKMRSS